MLEHYSIEAARLAYGERIIRCTNPDPALAQDLLSLDGQIEKAALWLACAYAKRQGDPDHIRGLLAYLFSHVGPLNLERRAWLVEQIERRQIGLRDLTQEMLVGTYLEWTHIFRLTGRQFNPSRVRERVRRLYEQILQESQRTELGGGGQPLEPIPITR
ncbi:MAG: hypothetical protein NZ610_00815 [Candidatus Bipolaricaulota bacterium]|nr:hypothetical protein [Candidatus Bipolaricaulota bacterium]MCS7273938.1 hypothetical protein [Candidatus Bipolaricaulota bacterium]MDW8110433.1 hypothetical protein [Candidatus Bipolaricaulota bacterium]MDW8329925.1 hypothetical protein [Candidatus Bipolaricaulota bacterium]